MAWGDVQAKLERMGTHLEAIRDVSHEYLKSDKLGITSDFESEPGFYLVRAFVHEAPPKSYSVLVGEMLYHLRSVLDYVAWQLTEDAGETPTEDTEFIIWTRPTGFGELGDPKSANFKRIGKMRQEHQEIIRNEQPFQLKFGSIEDDPLSWLYYLSNIDRHRFLHVVTTTVVEGYLAVDSEEAKERLKLIDSTLGPVNGEREVARFAIVPGRELSVKLEPNIRFDIAFAEESVLPYRPVSKVLGAIGIRVGGIVQALRGV
jgi:hypothetical protein